MTGKVYRSSHAVRDETRGWFLLAIGTVMAIPAGGFVLVALMTGARPW